MFALLAVLLAVSGVIGGSAEWHDKLERLAEPLESRVSHKDFRQLHAESGEKFGHGADLLAALRAGQTEFEVREALTAENPEVKQWNLNDYDGTKEKGFYQARTLYKLHADHSYLIVDSKTSPRKLSATEMLDCTGRIKDKTFLVSSDVHGSHHYVTAARVAPESGRNCVKLETEQIHPWELFSNMNIQAFVDRPFHTQYNNGEDVEEPAVPAGSRKLGNDDIAPGKSCLADHCTSSFLSSFFTLLFLFFLPLLSDSIFHAHSHHPAPPNRYTPLCRRAPQAVQELSDGPVPRKQLDPHGSHHGMCLCFGNVTRERRR